MGLLSASLPITSSSLPPPSSPATEKPSVEDIDLHINVEDGDGQDSEHRLIESLKRLSETRDVPEFTHFTVDWEQYRKLYERIGQICRRFDYEPRRNRLTIRMPSLCHDYFAAYFNSGISEELNKIASCSEEAKTIGKSITGVLCCRVFLAETDEKRPIERGPDIQFHYAGARYPGIVVEVAYSQSVKDLRRLAQDYILYSNGNIKLVIGINLGYRGESSTVSLWRPKFTTSENGRDLETFEHIREMPFCSSDGIVLNPDEFLTIDMREFATDKLSKNWPAATINISFSRLAQYAQDAPKRQKELQKSLPLDDDSVGSPTKRKWPSSSEEELRSEDEARYSNEEDAV